MIDERKQKKEEQKVGGITGVYICGGKPPRKR
jgi:hypothetical protein